MKRELIPMLACKWLSSFWTVVSHGLHFYEIPFLQLESTLPAYMMLITAALEEHGELLDIVLLLLELSQQSANS